jgi:4'-phosphopantetheinyl transferase
MPEGVDLWCFFYEDHVGGELAKRYEALMTPDERARHERYYFDKDRRLFLATRALVRCALSHYAEVAPEDWRFDQTEHGKPFVVGPAGAPELQFNLSNTYGLVACAVSGRVQQVGVDVENTTRGTDAIEIADRFFSELEVEALHALPEERQRERFFSYWTLKESYIKARGLGLAIPLGQFSFLLDEAPPIRIRFGDEIDDDPKGWRFRLFQASEDHVLALGAEVGGELSLRWTRYVPLAERLSEGGS